MQKAIVKVMDVVTFAGNLVILGEVLDGHLKKGMIADVEPDTIKVARIEQGGKVVKEADPGRRVNIWIKGFTKKENLEEASYALKFDIKKAQFEEK